MNENVEMSLQDSRNAKIDKRLFFLLISGLTALAIWTWGYQLGTGDHAFHLVYIYHVHNPQLYPGDSFVQTLSHYYSYFWTGVAFLTRLIPIEPLFLLLFVASYLGFFYALYCLARLLFNDHNVAILAGLLAIFFNFVPWGGSHILPTILDHGAIVRPLLIWAFILIMQDKWLLAAVLVGVCFNIHPMITSFMIWIIIIIFLFCPVEQKRKALPGALIALALAAPMLWQIFSSSAALPTSQARQSWLNLMRLRLWHHLFPSYWSTKLFLAYALLVASWLISLSQSPRNRKYHKDCLILALSVGLLCIIGTIGSEIYPLGLVLKLHLFRATKFWAVLLFCYLANFTFWLYRSLTSKYNFRYLPIYILAFLLLIMGLWQRLSLSPGLKQARQQEREWHQLQTWAKDNTDIAARFLTPPYLTGFRVGSQRSCYAEWKDGSALLWSPDWVVNTWWPRLLKIAPQFQELPKNPYHFLKQAYLNLTPEEVLTFPADYLVTTRIYDQFRQMTKIDRYYIYKLGSPSPSARDFPPVEK